jgi:hypothetical protein
MTAPASRTGERPVRVALHRLVADAIAVVDEFWLPTDERADVAAIYDDRMAGFEIKSARDTLVRLPRQVRAYSRVFDRCSLVVAQRHAVTAWVPDWWGVIVVDQEGCFQEVRAAEPNPGLYEDQTLVRLLWKRDVAAELTRLRVVSGRRRGWDSYSRQLMWHQLLDRVDLEELRACVRRAVVRRALERAPTGEIFPPPTLGLGAVVDVPDLAGGTGEVGGAEIGRRLAIASGMGSPTPGKREARHPGTSRQRRAMAKATQDGTYTLTPARRRALEVFARAARGEARESNETSPPAAVGADTAMPKIYWQSRAWLEVEGLIEALPGRLSWYRLTAAGVELVEQLGLREAGAGHRVAAAARPLPLPTHSENAGVAVPPGGCVAPSAPGGSDGRAEAWRERGDNL